MDQTVSPVNEVEDNLFSYTYNSPQAYNCEPVSQDREQEQGRTYHVFISVWLYCTASIELINCRLLFFTGDL